MHPAWRLATSSLSRRRSRTGLLIASVTMCALLISAITCSMASLQAALDSRVKATVGAADVKLRHVGSGTFDQAVLQLAEGWAGVKTAAPRSQESVPLKNPLNGKEVSTIGYGIMADREAGFRPIEFEVGADGKPLGRLAKLDGEVTLDTISAVRLEAKLGDTLEVVRFGEPVTLKVVGIIKQPPLGAIFEKMEVFTTLATLATIADRPGRISEIDIILDDKTDAIAFAALHKGELPSGLLLQATAKITSGLSKNLRSNQIGLLLASTLALFASAFIIMTGLTTAVTEKAREMSVLRCLGAFKSQLATSQLLVGMIIGGLGGLLGTPLGVGASAALVYLFPAQLPGGFSMSWSGVALAIGGSLVAGLIGAVWPAIMAARVSPLEGLSVRSRPARYRWVYLCLGAAIVLLAVQLTIINGPLQNDIVFWMYIFLGVPSMLVGYFLLSVPLTLAVNAIIAGPIGVVLGLPRTMLSRTVRATPFRHGFTAGAMMLGLAMMVSIWTNGRAVLQDWLEAMQIPDGFVQGINMRESTQRRIEAIDGVASTTAITLQSVETDAFGVRGLSKYKTSFIAFEPRGFFAQTKVTWVAPTEPAKIAGAIDRLVLGNTVIIAREFQVARGLGVGDMITLTHEGKPNDFEIVGIVTSPGLDIVSKFYDVGEGYVDQAINAVFGSREDLKTKFGNDAINLIQVALKPGADGKAVMAKVSAIRGGGILSAGSAVEIKGRITEFISGSLFVFSVVAIGAMLIACFAVANLIIAGITARQFEFGVLRAVGAQRGLLARLVIGEAMVIAATACVLGTAMGLQAAAGGLKMYSVVIGLVLQLRPPWIAIGVGCAAVFAITLLAAWPPVHRLIRRHPRELLGAMKG